MDRIRTVSTWIVAVSLGLGGAWTLCSQLSCRGDGRPAPVEAERARAVVLSEQELVELEIPGQVRPGGAEPPDKIPLEGPFRYAGTTRKGMHKYVMPIPIRPRGLFFHKAQPGIRLTEGDGGEVRYDRFGKSDKPMWAHDRSELTVYMPEQVPPEPGQFVLEYPKATARERDLNWEWSLQKKASREQREFVWTTIQDDWDHRRGLLLPAPGRAAWELTVPPSAELHFVGGIVLPELATGAPSDGATLVVEVEVAGAVQPLATLPVKPGEFEPHKLDMSRWEGQQVKLRIRSEPGASSDYDYVLVGEPVVASRERDPVRVLMVFIDTLRPDHLSLYGYERDTSKAIDHLAEEAVVFTRARTVAPWTLPSARSVVTGRQPEHYGRAPTVQDLLRERGWATGFIAGNVYLSVNFLMHQGWDFHRVGLWPQAKDSTDDALAWLAEHEGRDALLQVHYMSTHLPYSEPQEYRDLYAGQPVGALREEFHLTDVHKSGADKDPEAQKYIQDRYDNNIRYVTDQVKRLLEVLDDNDVLVLFSDHGEEFWDHGGFEHGHTLYEELLHVPLVIDAPGIEGASTDAPVSLLDITPTILDLVGVPLPEKLDGRSLVPLLRREEGAAEPFLQRDHAFGRPLYGTERWGVLHGQEKWSTFEGKEFLFDLEKDPEEKKNKLKKEEQGGQRYHDLLAKALGREVSSAYRLMPSAWEGPSSPGLWVMCTVPGGFGMAFRADDPLENSSVTVQRLEDPAQIRARLTEFGIDAAAHTVPDDAGAVELCWNPGWAGSREVYLTPEDPLEQVGHQMVCSAYLGDAGGGQQGTMRIPPERDPTLAGPRTPALAKLALGGRQLMWQFGISPEHGGELRELSGRDDETNEMLEAMGYVDPDSDGLSGKPSEGGPARLSTGGDASSDAPPPCVPPSPARLTP
jgi:arylsulfatase A-like enzyme